MKDEKGVKNFHQRARIFTDLYEIIPQWEVLEYLKYFLHF